MESDLQQHAPLFLDHQGHHHHQHQQMNSGLSRYKSAPSSYFSNIIDREFYEDLFKRPSSPETERIFARFMNSLGDSDGDGASVAAEDSLAENLSSVQPPQQQQIELPAVKEEIDQQSQTMASMSTESSPVVVLQQQQQQLQSSTNSFQNLYQSSGRPPLPTQMKTGRGSTSNLIRHGSSPAGLFANINIDTGYAAAIRGMGALGASSTTNEEATFSPSARLKNTPNFSSGLLSPRAEIGSKSITQNNPEAEGFAETRGNEFPGFPLATTWDDSAVMSENISGLKRFRDDDVKPFSGLNAAESQNETGGQAPAPLAHHMSLPNTSAEMAAIEKFLKFSDSVPCKIRAKRGCATHPRSIAERVRRTKISERMRKLQDLVPNMDKQTNTSDMLDLAVEYIKDLQNQVQTLSDCRAKCSCKHQQQ